MNERDYNLAYLRGMQARQAGVKRCEYQDPDLKEAWQDGWVFADEQDDDVAGVAPLDFND